MTAAYIGLPPRGGPADLRERIRAEGRGEIVSIPLPWTSLHRAVGYGLRPGCVTVVAGSPGASKSLLALNLALHARARGFRWRYLPLEDNAERWIEKTMAVHCRDWRLMGNPDEDSDDARARLAAHKELLLAAEGDLWGELYDRIRENPRVLAAGECDANPVPFGGVLDWVRRECDEEGTELVIIDPVAQIDFSGRDKDYKQQEAFMQALTGIAQRGVCHVVLVAHIAKRPGRTATLSSMDDLQGAAAFARLAHYVLLLDRHDEREAEVFSSRNAFVSHQLTLTVGKARDGFSGVRVAMDLMREGPRFHEHGIVKPAKQRRAT